MNVDGSDPKQLRHLSGPRRRRRRDVEELPVDRVLVAGGHLHPRARRGEDLLGAVR